MTRKEERIIMHIGVFSDIHDNLKNLNKLLSIYQERNIKTLIFCGDFCSPIPLRVLGGFDGKVHCVFGNNDGDRFTMLQIVNKKFSNIKLHGEYAQLSFNGRGIAATHYPLYGETLAKTGNYQAVFSGHTHSQTEKNIGDCLWLNPGEVMGWNGRATCAIYDVDANAAEIISL